MKKLLLGLTLLVTLGFANGTATAQLFQTGPYYANPSWDQQLPAGQRFIVLSDWNNAAVLDRETGLVWQRIPEIPGPGNGVVANEAVLRCWEATTGGRKGWRLPVPEELMSLVDPTQTFPALPAGHPFQQLGAIYWTASTLSTTVPPSGYYYDVRDGGTNSAVGNIGLGVWCVRGGSHVLTRQ